MGLLRFIAGLLLLLSSTALVMALGFEIGAFVQLFVASLAYLASLLLATRWPRLHLASGAGSVVVVLVCFQP